MITADEEKQLCDIVGPEWVSTDPCMMDTYAFYMNPEMLNREGGRWLPRPAVVVMPDGTEQVSAVVRLCNRLGLMVKPISTGFGTWAAVSRDRVIVLDLKRMDRIIDIDVKNQIALIEPYVKAIVLQTELFKQGLNVHVVSCGGNHSILASVTSGWGTGTTGPSMGHSSRNLLGVEWVLPTGDVLTLGSAGEGAGWFSADGPGPSLRGIVRGNFGALGSLGVFTKCAVKLYKWDGPAELSFEGCSPHYLIKDLPSNVGLFAIPLPSIEALTELGYKLGEAEISYADFRLPAFMAVLGVTDHNAALKKIWESGLFQRLTTYGLIVAVVGYSQREYDWRIKALKEILKEVNGVNMPLILPFNSDPSERQMKYVRLLLRCTKDLLALLRWFPSLQTILDRLPINKKHRQRQISEIFWVLLRHAINTQGNFRPSQANFTVLGAFDTWDLGIRQSEWVAEKKRELIEKDLIVDDGGDCGCGGTFESGHLGYLEGIGLYNRSDPKSVIAVSELVEQGVQACIDEALGIPLAGFGHHMNTRLGPECSDYHIWMERIKKALDPNEACDPFFYIDPSDLS